MCGIAARLAKFVTGGSRKSKSPPIPRIFANTAARLVARWQDETPKKPFGRSFWSQPATFLNLHAKSLQNKAADSKNVHIFREEILKDSSALIRHLPSELVDFMLASYLEAPDDGDDPFGSHSDHVMEELGIGDHFQFYPASPAQPPFLALLRLHEQQALRLIRGFCNHSISIWRKAKERGRRYAEPLTPIPLTLTFPWGAQTFWGDAQVYLWFRGTWGNAAVKSALMALEQWALEQLDKGATFDDIFRKAIEATIPSPRLVSA